MVVYKIDRLTRSLSDFARIVEVFDGNGVSFVSVTQQFNTTTSMGRLTLNVLLSFAQFEREVTAERIRDKIAASKAKGMWMGGTVPLGYEVIDRKLIVKEPEASFVRALFTRYLELKSVPALAAEVTRDAALAEKASNATPMHRHRAILSPVRSPTPGVSAAACSTSFFPTHSTSANSGIVTWSMTASTSHSSMTICSTRCRHCLRPTLSTPRGSRIHARITK